MARRFRLSHLLVTRLEELGIPPDAVMRRACMPKSLRADDRMLVTTEQFFAFWSAIEELGYQALPLPGRGARASGSTRSATHATPTSTQSNGSSTYRSRSRARASWTPTAEFTVWPICTSQEAPFSRPAVMPIRQ